VTKHDVLRVCMLTLSTHPRKGDVTGLTVHDFEPATFAGQFCRLLGDTVDIHPMSAPVQRVAWERFSVDAVVNRYIALCREIIETGS
jgi:hypothetical protein